MVRWGGRAAASGLLKLGPVVSSSPSCSAAHPQLAHRPGQPRLETSTTTSPAKPSNAVSPSAGPRSNVSASSVGSQHHCASGAAASPRSQSAVPQPCSTRIRQGPPQACLAATTCGAGQSRIRWAAVPTAAMQALHMSPPLRRHPEPVEPGLGVVPPQQHAPRHTPVARRPALGELTPEELPSRDQPGWPSPAEVRVPGPPSPEYLRVRLLPQQHPDVRGAGHPEVQQVVFARDEA